MFSLFKKKEKPVFISEYRKQEILKEIVPYGDRKNITAVIMDDGGYMELTA